MITKPEDILEKPEDMLATEEVLKLTNLIKDTFRIRPNHNPTYVDVSNHLTRFLSPQHQIVFGRRGTGKSCLFVHFLRDKTINEGILPIYIEGDELKTLTYPDLLVRLLLHIFEKMPSANQRWRKWVRLPNPIQKHITDLRRILSQAEETIVKQTDSSNVVIGAALAKNDSGVHGQNSTNHSKQSEFKELKIDHLERYLRDYKTALSHALKRSKYKFAFVLVDDFYLITRSRQPEVIDYLHRLLRGTDFYLKVGTVRHRTSILKKADQSIGTIGIEMHQDVEEINLDRTLENVESTSEYLSQMLDSLARTAHLHIPKDSLFNPEAFHALVLASGGVPRDFLNIFVEAVSSSNADGNSRWLTPTYIWKGAGRISYLTKLKNLKSEASTDSSPLENVYRDLVSFCLKEKKKTAFLVSQEQAQQKSNVHELILQLMDFKLIHVIEPDTSAASNRKGRFEAYTLDFSLFMEPRIRNIEHVQFWKVDSDQRRIGLREAPDYDLTRAEKVMIGEPDPNAIDDILREAGSDTGDESA